MKYSEELVKEICENIENGVLNKDAAILCGIGESTFYEWLREENADGTPNPNFKPEFSESIKIAEMKRKRSFIAQIVKASESQWQAAAWYLERVYNKEFAKRQISQVEDRDKSEGVKLLRKLLSGDKQDRTKETSSDIQGS